MQVPCVVAFVQFVVLAQMLDLSAATYKYASPAKQSNPCHASPYSVVGRGRCTCTFDIMPGRTWQVGAGGEGGGGGGEGVHAPHDAAWHGSGDTVSATVRSGVAASAVLLNWHAPLACRSASDKAASKASQVRVDVGSTSGTLILWLIMASVIRYTGNAVEVEVEVEVHKVWSAVRFSVTFCASVPVTAKQLIVRVAEVGAFVGSDAQQWFVSSKPATALQL